MITVKVLVGVSGVGKSTYIKSLKGNVKVFSSDKYREELFGSKEEGNKIYTDDNGNTINNSTITFEKMHKDMYSFIQKHNRKEDITIVYDSMNLSRKRRRGVYSTLKSRKHSVDVVETVVFFLDEETINKNQENRFSESKDVGHYVNRQGIRKLLLSLQIPREGVDTDIISYHGQKWFSEINFEEVNTLTDILQYIKNESVYNMVKLNFDDHHCRPYHYETIDEHINLTISNSNSLDMKKVALFHDITKGYAKHFEEKEDYINYRRYKNNEENISEEEYENLRAKYNNHDRMSAYYMLNYLYSINNFKDMALVEVVNQHMNSHKGISKKAQRKNNLSEDLMEIISQFSEIDSKSRRLE